MSAIIQDLRNSIRTLRKRPLTSILVALTLSFGIGATSAVFSVVNTVLLRPLPYKDSDRVVLVSETQQQGPTRVSPANFLDWKEQNQGLEQVAAYLPNSFNLTGDGEPERISGTLVDGNFFEVVATEPLLGRVFLPGSATARNEVVLSEALWKNRFGSDVGTLGKSLRLNGESYTIVGVLPSAFDFPAKETDLWVLPQQAVPPPPIQLPPNIDLRMLRGLRYLSAVAKLKSDVSLAQAQVNMDFVARRLEEQYPQANNGAGVKITSLREYYSGNVRPALIMLTAAVGLVLLIACANVASLMVARALTRQKEIAIRLALGASRWRLIQLLLTESILLALIGGALGVLLAHLGINLLIAFSPEYIPHLRRISIDGWVLGFALTISVLTGIIFGLFPAVQASNPNLNETLKEESRGGSSGLKRQRLRGLLVIGETALALVLLISTGLIIRTLLRVQEIKPGFEPSGVLTLQVFLPSTEYNGGVKQTAFYRRVITRIEAITGVESVGATNLLPMSGSNASLSFTIEGQSVSNPDERPSAAYRAINSDYFRTMRIPLVRGRTFTDENQSKQVAIISDSMARQYPFGSDPIGKYITVGNESEPREIIGMVGNVRHSGLDSGPEATFYLPYVQSPSRFMFFAIRTTVPPASMVSALQAAIHAEDAALPVYNVKTMEQRLEDTLAPRRFNIFLLSIFSLVALILVVGGIYGIVASSVAQRTHEIGIRMALGGQKLDILFLVLKDALRLTLMGIAAGLMAALLLTRFLSNLLYEVSANDPSTFIGITVLLIGVALAACLIPALRATRVDPIIALRSE